MLCLAINFFLNLLLICQHQANMTNKTARLLGVMLTGVLLTRVDYTLVVAAHLS